MNDRIRVLLIDDDPAARAALISFLNVRGLESHALPSPIGATRAIRELKIDVVVCDLDMPAMRGDAFARMFRKTTLFAKLPLVILSAASRDELDALRATGICDAVVHKADIHSELVPLLQRLRPGSP